MRRFAAGFVALALASMSLAGTAGAYSPSAQAADGVAIAAPNDCARAVLPSVDTTLTGARADEAERLQGLYENEPGFMSVVFGGGSFWIVVDGASPSGWTMSLPSNLRTVTSCVDSRLIGSARAVIAETRYAPGDYSSVAYNAFTDSVDVISTLDTKSVADAIDHRVATTWNPSGALGSYALGDVRFIAAASASGAGRMTRGSDVAPYYGGAQIRVPGGYCSTGFYINSATNGTVMVSAGHCTNGVNGATIKTGDGTHTVGVVEGASFTQS